MRGNGDAVSLEDFDGTAGMHLSDAGDLGSTARVVVAAGSRGEAGEKEGVWYRNKEYFGTVALTFVKLFFVKLKFLQKLSTLNNVHPSTAVQMKLRALFLSAAYQAYGNTNSQHIIPNERLNF